jgi:4-diphosphocytidyl-2-C-methyl-D-erythritol kinase
MLERFAPAGAAAPRDIYISIHKHIPVAAGLAGGSTDAAAVMLALADEWNIEADLSQLCAISVSIGADVPFSLAANAKNNAGRYAADPMASSTALAEGIGDILTPLPAPPGAIILVKPNLSLSTARIYCVYDRAPEKAARPDTDGFLRYLRSGKPTAGAPTETTAPLVTHMVNALQYAAASESPETASLIGDLANALPAAKVFLSGSGPTVAAYFQDRAEAEAALPAVRKRFERDGTRVFLPIILA